MLFVMMVNDDHVEGMDDDAMVCMVCDDTSCVHCMDHTPDHDMFLVVDTNDIEEGMEGVHVTWIHRGCIQQNMIVLREVTS